MIRLGSDFVLTVTWQLLPGMLSKWKDRSVSPISLPLSGSYHRNMLTANKIKAAVHPTFECRKMQTVRFRSNNTSCQI